jgi:tripartite-type tricarboxylate transporter receptor subunit TctC
MRKIWIRGRGVAVLAALLASAMAAAQDYPARPIRLIVPFAAGGPTEILARMLGEQLRPRLGQPLIVESRPGGNAMIGLEAVARSQPDGYTLGVGGATLTEVPHISPVNFRPIDDFTHIARFGNLSLFFVAGPSLPAKSMSELVAYLKANPKRVNYGVVGIGSGDHLLAELFQIRTGTQMTVVTYKGASAVLQDLLAGRIELEFLSSPSLIKAHVDSGTLRLLAVAADKRVDYAPEVPTLAETGLGNVEIPAYLTLVGPAGMPRAAVNRIETAVKETLADPANAEQFRNRSVQPSFLGSDALTQQMRHDYEFVGKLIQDAGIKPQ